MTAIVSPSKTNTFSAFGGSVCSHQNQNNMPYTHLTLDELKSDLNDCIVLQRGSKNDLIAQLMRGDEKRGSAATAKPWG